MVQHVLKKATVPLDHQQAEEEQNKTQFRHFRVERFLNFFAKHVGNLVKDGIEF